MEFLKIDSYDEDRIIEISGEIAAAIDAATMGAGAWEEVPAAFSRAFPGSWAGIHNMNFSEVNLNFLSAHNIEPDYLASFQEHFAFINPWNAHWSTAKSGTAALSEEVAPARLFARTEFYNDWLLPQKVEAAAGIKIDGDHGETIQFMMHYSLSSSEKYDYAVAEILRRTRGNLVRSIDFAKLMRRGAEQAIAGATLVERGRCAALVVDDTRHIREANQQAVDLLAQSAGVVLKGGRLALAEKNADASFGVTLAELSRGVSTDRSRIAFRTSAGAWQVSMSALPIAPSSSIAMQSLLSPRALVLVLITRIDAKSEGRSDQNLSPLATMFGLAPSEIVFCRRLLEGASVADAADHLRITIGTARTRLKMVLQKTDTSRQSELILLLSSLL